LSKPSELPEGTTSSKTAQPHSEPAIAVWVGEKKGAPATVALYPISALVGKAAADADKTETRDMPTTTARKAFYKADKLQVKWNNAGTMVCSMGWMDPFVC
jgi:translation initiation factor 2A